MEHADTSGGPVNVKGIEVRTPDLTEALARLKALEERLHAIEIDGDYWTDIAGDEVTVWAKEIAAIRGKLGAE